jgi:hypothetical protein
MNEYNSSSIYIITKVSKNMLYNGSKANSPIISTSAVFLLYETSKNVLYFAHKSNSKHPTAAVSLLIFLLCFYYQ